VRRPALVAVRLLAAVVALAIAAAGCSGGGTTATTDAGAATNTVGPFDTPDVTEALEALRSKLGPDGRLLLMSIGEGVIDFDVLEAGASAPRGYSWLGRALTAQPSGFTPGAGRTLADAAFPLSAVDPAVPAMLAARAADVAAVAGYHVTSMSISRTLVGPGRYALQWTVADTDDASAPVLVARPDGSGYRRLT
jgi:hypothetical protein